MRQTCVPAVMSGLEKQQASTTASTQGECWMAEEQRACAVEQKRPRVVYKATGDCSSDSQQRALRDSQPAALNAHSCQFVCTSK
jgi:plasmid replication initiation protein